MGKVRFHVIAMFICVFAISGLKGQDTHYSMFNLAPMELNPALAGLNNCDYRIVANARTQWSTVSGIGNAYNTFGASADFAVGKVTKFNSFAGIGISVISDFSGATSYKTDRAALTAAYHFMLDRRGNASISAGLQVAFNYRGFTPGTFDDQYNPQTGHYDPSLPSGENFARNNMVYVDAGFGLLYSQYFKRRKNNIYIGLAVDHVNQPNISWQTPGVYNNSSSDDKLFAKVTIHGGASFQVGDKVWIMPNFMLLFQGPSQEYDLGAMVRFRVGNTISTTFMYVGAQYRAPLDAFAPMVRLDYKGFTAGFSYDINISKLIPASQTVGAPELAIMYTGCLRKKPHPYLCPTL
jgi:type IX secretion system PorP/SprF family membrane protein